jgi:hypothetical protein
MLQVLQLAWQYSQFPEILNVGSGHEERHYSIEKYFFEIFIKELYFFKKI